MPGYRSIANDRGSALSDFARLESVLAKLGGRERAPGEGRKLEGSDIPARLAALVSEIDETILPRRLTLGLDGQALHLAVANRRLQAMLAPAPALDGAGELAGQALPDVEDPGVASLRALLDTFLAGQGQIDISARRLDVNFGSDIGVPANLLARAWGVEDQPARVPLEPIEVLTQYLSDLGDDAVAWLRIEGEEVSDEKGEAERVAKLGEQAALFLDGYFGKFEALFPAEARSCGTIVAPVEGEAMFFVEIGDVSAFVAASPDRIAGIAQRWQAMVAE